MVRKAHRLPPASWRPTGASVPSGPSWSPVAGGDGSPSSERGGQCEFSLTPHSCSSQASNTLEEHPPNPAPTPEQVGGGGSCLTRSIDSRVNCIQKYTHHTPRGQGLPSGPCGPVKLHTALRGSVFPAPRTVSLLREAKAAFSKFYEMASSPCVSQGGPDCAAASNNPKSQGLQRKLCFLLVLPLKCGAALPGGPCAALRDRGWSFCFRERPSAPETW